MPTPTAQTLIETIVLVFARSPLRELVGTDALRTMLQAGQLDLVPEPGTLVLEPVWELIASQPGFTAEKAYGPLCKLKSWEDKLEVRVVLPAAMADLAPVEQAMYVRDCHVTLEELEKLLAPPTRSTPLPVVLSTSTVEPTARASSSRTGIAVAIMLIGLVAAGVSIYLSFNKTKPGTNLESISPREISDQIPIVAVRKSGPMLDAVLADASWVAKPEAVRRQQLEATVPNVRSHGGIALVLHDAAGIVVGSVTIDNIPTVVIPPATP